MANPGPSLNRHCMLAWLGASRAHLIRNFVLTQPCTTHALSTMASPSASAAAAAGNALGEINVLTASENGENCTDVNNK